MKKTPKQPTCKNTSARKVTMVKTGYPTTKKVVLKMESPFISLLCDQIWNSNHAT